MDGQSSGRLSRRGLLTPTARTAKSETLDHLEPDLRQIRLRTAEFGLQIKEIVCQSAIRNPQSAIAQTRLRPDAGLFARTGRHIANQKAPVQFCGSGA